MPVHTMGPRSRRRDRVRHTPARLLVRWPPGSGAETTHDRPQNRVRRWVPLDAVHGAHGAPAGRHVVEPLLQLLEPVEVQMTGDGQQVQLLGCHRCVCVLRHLLATPTCVTVL